MYRFECEALLDADPAAVWAVWTDIARWPEWDVTKEIARLDGPFEPGVSGWAKQRGNLGGSFTITAVDAGHHWISECPVPLGKVVFDHVIEPAGQGRARVIKRVEATGGIAPLVRLLAPTMRRDIAVSLAALGRLAAAPPPGRRGTGRDAATPPKPPAPGRARGLAHPGAGRNGRKLQPG